MQGSCTGRDPAGVPTGPEGWYRARPPRTVPTPPTPALAGLPGPAALGGYLGGLFSAVAG